MMELIPMALLETIYMVVVSTILSAALGLGLAMLMVQCKTGFTFTLLTGLTNIGRSFPFAILLVALIPFTKWVIGTSIGTTAAIVPLTVAAIPFFARLAQSAFEDVNPGLLEAAQAMGATRWQQITRVIIPESLPQLVLALSNLSISLLGYSTMAGLVGGGGLGKVAIQYGYWQYNVSIMVACCLLLIVLVIMLQRAGNWGCKAIKIRRGLV